MNVKLVFLILTIGMISTNFIFSQSTIVVEINHITSQDGLLMVSLHNSKIDFPKKPLTTIQAEIINGKSIVEFLDIPYGIYAISVIHDANVNGKLDFNLLHIPCEATAASNNARGFIGPPDFKDAKFEVKSERVYQYISL